MRGNSFLFFAATTLLCVVAFFVLCAPNADAYAIGSTAGTSTGFDANYNFGGSFQNLILPFRIFFNSLQFNTNATIDIHPTNVTIPPINNMPSTQTIFIQFDNWFYGLTNIRLSGVIAVAYNGILWIMGAISATAKKK